MPIGQPTDPQIKAEIITKIRHEGMSVTNASTTYGISTKTIYTWLRDGVVDGNRNLILELNKLRKENEQLYKLLGRATAEMQRPKKLAILEEVEPGWLGHFVAWLGISKSSYYEQPRALRARDACAVQVLRQAHTEHPFYGVKRLALHLGWSEKKTRRIRNLAGVVIPRASKKHHAKRGQPEISAPPNILRRYASFKNEARPQDGMDYSGMTGSGGWVQDFTYMWFERSMHYLAVVLDLKTRQVVGWRLGLSHSSELTHAALLDALSRHPAPVILHSDQGSEYLSYKHQELCQRMEIQLSCSDKSSPWQNGYMERWFGGFKRELGPLNQFRDLPQLHEAIALQIHYYNTERIHSALGMSPAAYAAQLKLSADERELVSGKRRG